MSYKTQTIVAHIYKNADEYQSSPVEVHFNALYHVDCFVKVPLFFVPQDLASDMRAALDANNIDHHVYEFSYTLIDNMGESIVTQGNRTFKRIEYA
jgi:hypothetical protein